MKKSIRTVFDEHCKYLIVDRALLTKVKRYDHNFVNKNQDHALFFGGVLMGVHPVRYLPDDQLRWFHDILGIDEISLERDIHALPTVNTSWNVSSNVTNLSFLYLMHRFLTSKDLTSAQQEEGAIHVAKIMNYKFFTSTLTGWFTYNANPAVAQTTYSLLTRKFGLKLAGSWGKLIEKRATDIVKKGGLHRKTLERFEPDKKIIDMANDTWGRVKSILKYIRNVFTTAQNLPDYQVQTTSNTIDLEGETRIRDNVKLMGQYQTYIQGLVGDRRSFLKAELVNAVGVAIPSVSRTQLENTLQYMSKNASVKADKDVQAFIRQVVEHGVNYIDQNPGLMGKRTDLAKLLRRVKGQYTVAKNPSPKILEIRRLGERIAKRGAFTTRGSASRNPQVLAAIRTAIAMYVLLRTLTMKHYQR